jgi:hypothetical protein
MSDESTRRRPSQDEPPEVTAAHRLKVTYAPGQQERQQLGDQFNQQQQRQLAGIMLWGESFFVGAIDNSNRLFNDGTSGFDQLAWDWAHDTDPQLAKDVAFTNLAKCHVPAGVTKHRGTVPLLLRSWSLAAL